MKYLVVQEWHSTKNNHAGMLHMCNLLKNKYPNDYYIIKKNCNFIQNTNVFCRILNKIIVLANRIIYPISYLWICRKMLCHFKRGDKVFLLEYILPRVSQLFLAIFIKAIYRDVNVYGLVHLTPTTFMKTRNYKTMILNWSEYTDKILTLGSSLSLFLEEAGINKKNISTGFHYVDTSFYNPLEFINYRKKQEITIIVMGNMERNYLLIADIVKIHTDINWIICMGSSSSKHLFSGFDNVSIKGYVSEVELKNLMSMSDISLNVMNDTVGSNVITTSLAMGLAIIASDVGSIKDYCSTNNCLFCDNTVDSFSNAITELKNNSEKLYKMRIASLEKSKDFKIENVHKWFNEL